MNALHNLIFLLPWIVLYELHTSIFGHGMGCGLYSWIQIYSYRYVPTIAFLTILCIQILRQNDYKISFEKVTGIYAESLLWTFILVILGQLLDGATKLLPLVVCRPVNNLSLTMSMIGAGLWEELAFRLVLVGGLCLLCKHRLWTLLVITTTSILFMYVHNNIDAIDYYARLMYGLMFSLLYLKRGIGIACGTHAIYDIVVGVILVQDCPCGTN